MTILDQKVAQIYVSTDSRTGGNTYDGYMLTLAEKYGRPDSVDISKTAAVLQMSCREKGSAGPEADNTSKPAGTNTHSPSGANHSMWKSTDWRRHRNSERLLNTIGRFVAVTEA